MKLTYNKYVKRLLKDSGMFRCYKNGEIVNCEKKLLLDISVLILMIL